MNNKRIRIAVDVRDLTLEMGMGVYLYNLLDEIYKDRRFSIVLISDDDIPDEFREVSHERRVVRAVSNDAWEKIIAPCELLKCDADIYFNPRNFGIIKRCPIPCVVTIHDLTPLMYEGFEGDYEYYKKQFAFSINKSDLIMVDSRTTYDDINKLFPGNTSKIETVYLGVNKQFLLPCDRGKLGKLLYKLGLPSDYLLYVGSFAHQKNFILALKTIKGLKEKGVNKKLVALGLKRTLKKEDFDFIVENELKDDVIFIDKVTKEQLPCLYDGASILLFPSLYEGFGLPVLEACARYLPAIAYPSPTVKKLFKEGVIFSDMVDEWIEKAHELLTSKKNIYPYMKMKQEKIIRKYNWQDAASKTKDIFISLNKQKRKLNLSYVCSLLQFVYARFVTRNHISINISSLILKGKLGVFLTARPEDLNRFLSLIPKAVHSSIVVFVNENNDQYIDENIEIVKLNWGKQFQVKELKNTIREEFDKKDISQVVFIWNNATGYGYHKIEKEFSKLFPNLSLMSFDIKNRLNVLKT